MCISKSFVYSGPNSFIVELSEIETLIFGK